MGCLASPAEEGAQGAEEDDDVEGNDSHVNPLVLAERGFKQRMIECLLDLMANDRATHRAVPEGWIPEVSEVQASTQIQMTGSGS